MQFIAAAAHYLLGIPIFGWGDQVGFVYKGLLFLVALLIFTAYILLADRKIWAAVQVRRGPNVVGPFGLLQSFADLLKFLLKEPMIPASSDKIVFLLAPLVTSVLALSAWVVIPLDAGWALANINVGVLYIFAISSLGVYGIVMGGWASNSNYAFLGALRSAAQMESYEVSIGFVFITALAETNRPPFDLPEAESELVAGFMVEYSSAPYLLFQLGEYISIILMCAMTAVLFLGGWASPIDLPPFTWIPGVIWFVLKLFVVFFGFAMVKAFVHRYRYDQLMRIGWKVFLPLSLIMVVVVAGVLQFTGWGWHGGAM